MRVVATVLQPQLYYKSVPVTMTTTVNDIIVKLVSRYAVVAEDKDPNSFYLMEVSCVYIRLSRICRTKPLIYNSVLNVIPDTHFLHD